MGTLCPAHHAASAAHGNLAFDELNEQPSISAASTTVSTSSTRFAMTHTPTWKPMKAPFRRRSASLQNPLSSSTLPREAATCRGDLPFSSAQESFMG